MGLEIPADIAAIAASLGITIDPESPSSALEALASRPQTEAVDTLRAFLESAAKGLRALQAGGAASAEASSPVPLAVRLAASDKEEPRPVDPERALPAPWTTSLSEASAGGGTPHIELPSHRLGVTDSAHVLARAEERLKGMGREDLIPHARRMSRGPMGLFFLANGGANWAMTDRWFDPDILAQVPAEDEDSFDGFLHHTAPTVRATQERFRIFQLATQRLIELGFLPQRGAHLASLPSGRMRDLLTLDFSGLEDFSLSAIDRDPTALKAAEAFAQQQGKKVSRVLERDALELGLEGEFDLVTSNGLNFYLNENDLPKFYANLFRALRLGGFLVTSNIVAPAEWKGGAFNPADAQLQQTLLSLVIEPRWKLNLGSMEKTNRQLEEAGFEVISVIPDEANIFPTFVARRPLIANSTQPTQLLDGTPLALLLSREALAVGSVHEVIHEGGDVNPEGGGPGGAGWEEPPGEWEDPVGAEADVEALPWHSDEAVVPEAKRLPLIEFLGQFRGERGARLHPDHPEDGEALKVIRSASLGIPVSSDEAREVISFLEYVMWDRYRTVVSEDLKEKALDIFWNVMNWADPRHALGCFYKAIGRVDSSHLASALGLPESQELDNVREILNDVRPILHRCVDHNLALSIWELWELKLHLDALAGFYRRINSKTEKPALRAVEAVAFMIQKERRIEINEGSGPAGEAAPLNVADLSVGRVKPPRGRRRSGEYNSLMIPFIFAYDLSGQMRDSFVPRVETAVVAETRVTTPEIRDTRHEIRDTSYEPRDTTPGVVELAETVESVGTAEPAEADSGLLPQTGSLWGAALGSPVWGVAVFTTTQAANLAANFFVRR